MTEMACPDCGFWNNIRSTQCYWCDFKLHPLRGRPRGLRSHSKVWKHITHSYTVCECAPRKFGDGTSKVHWNLGAYGPYHGRRRDSGIGNFIYWFKNVGWKFGWLT